jgi:general stress protein 26
MAGAFADVAEKFREITERIVWCTVATVDRQGRPRSRILHPVWEDSVGWIATGRHSHKAKHLAKNPFVSLTYWDPQHEQSIVECRTAWADDLPTRNRIWELLKSRPEPVGYDPKLFWSAPDDPSFGVLKLLPWRLEVWSLQAMARGERPQVWRPASA